MGSLRLERLTLAVAPTVRGRLEREAAEPAVDQGTSTTDTDHYRALDMGLIQTWGALRRWS